MKLHPDAASIVSFFANETDPARLSARRRLAWRVGDALRLVVDRLIDNQAPDTEFEALAADFEHAAERLGAHGYGRRYDVAAGASAEGAGGSTGEPAEPTVGPPSSHTDYSPLLGRSNPLAPPMRFWLEGDTVMAEATFGNAYEGPPGCVHGGIISAAFDEVLGATQAASGDAGMTGTLTVVYRSPSPLHQPIRFEATLDDVQGRKLLTSARSYVAGPSGDVTAADRVLCAESTGIFITVDFDKLAADVVAKRADADATTDTDTTDTTGDTDTTD